MEHILILENIRSAYNTGVMIRTCDALGRKVVISGFTPDPAHDEKVKKTSLGAEQTTVVGTFWNPDEALQTLRDRGYTLIAAEKTPDAQEILAIDRRDMQHPIALVMGNEKTGVLAATLAYVDMIVHIPMQGMKESLNVAEAAAILIWEISFGR